MNPKPKSFASTALFALFSLGIGCFALAVLTAAGCGDEDNASGRDDASTDAAELWDAGLADGDTDGDTDGAQQKPDAAANTDASPNTDAVANTDAAASADSGSGVDGGSSPDAGVTCPYVVYMDTAGDDALDGDSPATAVATLERVQEILVDASPPCDVEVRINQGTYQGQTVIWTYYHPSYKVQLMPIDYQGGGISSIAGRPLFDGQGLPYLFRLDVASGQPTNIEFIYLRFEGYRQFALHFLGNRNDFAAGWNGYNRVFGCYFYDIGNLASPGGPGYGALDLVNSRLNTIRNNHFVQIENAPSDAGLMHAVYLAHGSGENEISNNQFHEISGDPIRARDDSSQNQILDNVFSDTGSSAFYSDWWCDMSQNPNCTKPGGECPSWENEFRNNELHCGYDGASLSTFTYFQGETYVPTWCTDHFPDGWARLYTSGNTKTCP